ncbi:MAG: hypothetical protein H6842_14750 [Rhodospirillaceae bacterium]|nr:hypothetical protein [Rhodospirillaceae bacterium]
MKLTDHQIEEVQRQTGGLPIPESSTEFEILRGAFGDDSFYAATTGIIVWEWKEDHLAPVREAVAVQVATWRNRDAFEIVKIPRRRTQAVIRLPVSGIGIRSG